MSTATYRDGFEVSLRNDAGVQWDVMVTTFPKYSTDKFSDEIIASFATEAQAQVAYEQVLAAVTSDRGVMHLVRKTPCWEIRWFDPVTFEISSRFTRDEAEKNRLVEFYTTKAQFPVKVTESPIEHWSENPLFADEHGTEGAR